MTQSAGESSKSTRSRSRSSRVQKQNASFDSRKASKPTTVHPGETFVAKVSGWPWWPVLIKSEDQIPPDVKHVKRSPKQIYIYFYGTYEYSAVTMDKLRVFEADWWRARLENNELETEEYESDDENARTEAVRQALDPEYFEPIHNERIRLDWEEYRKGQAEMEEKERLKEERERLRRERADEKKRATAARKEKQTKKKPDEKPRVSGRRTRRGRQPGKDQTQDDQEEIINIEPQSKEPSVDIESQSQEQPIDIEPQSQGSTSDAYSRLNSTQRTQEFRPSQELHLTQDSQEARDPSQQVSKVPPVSETSSTQTEEQPVLAAASLQEQPDQEQGAQPVQEVKSEPEASASVQSGTKRGSRTRHISSPRQSKRTRNTSYESQPLTEVSVQTDSSTDMAIVPTSPNRQEPMVPTKPDHEAAVSANDVKMERDQPVAKGVDENGQDTEAHIKMRRRCIFISYRFQTLLDRHPTPRWPAKDNELMRVAIQDIHIVKPSARAIREVNLDHWIEMAYQKEYTVGRDGYDCKKELGSVLSSWERLLSS